MTTATLGFNIESSKALEAKANLDKMTGASKAAEKASEALSAASTRAAGGSKAMAQASEMVAATQRRVEAATRASTAAMTAQASASKAAAYQSRMLAIQAGDVVQSLALGMPVQQVLLQQGFQIQSLYGGLGATFKGVGGAARSAAAGLGRVALANPVITAGIGVMAGGLFNITRELRAAGHESITFADTAKAAWQVAASGISETLQPAIAAIAPYVGAAWDWISSKTKWLGNLIINSFRAAASDIKFLWNELPTIVGSAAIGAANATINGIERMINSATKLLNSFVRNINSTLPQSLQIGEIGKVDFGDITNPYRERAAEALAEHRRTIAEIMGSDPLGQFGSAIADQAIKNAAAATENLGSAAGKAKDAWDGLRKTVGDTVDKLRERVSNLGQSLGGIFRGLVDQTMTWRDAVTQAIQSVLSYLNQQNLAQGGAGLFGGGLFGSIAQGFLGFANGGYTGPSSASRVAGVVHGGEYVFSKAATDRIGVNRLESLHRSAKGYASGGYVAANSNMGAGNQNIAVQVEVTGVFVDDNGVIRAEVSNAIVTAAPAIRQSAKNDTLKSFTGGGAGEKILKNGYGVTPRGRRAS